MEDVLRELKIQSHRLNGLLADPQPGLATWLGFLNGTCLAIGDLAGVGKVSAMPGLLAACKAAMQDSFLQTTNGTGGLTGPVRDLLEAAINDADAEGAPPDA